MNWILLTFTVAVLNLGVGFMVGMRLGYGPPTVRAAWQALTNGPGDSTGAVGGDAMSQLADQLAADPLSQLVEDEESLMDEAMNDALEEAFKEIAADQAAMKEEEEEAAGELDPNDPENWDLNEKFIETSLIKLNIVMMKSGAKACSLDDQLRSAKDNLDSDTIHRCLEELKADCTSYLAEQAESAERFGQRINELGELSSLGEEIEMANLEQAAQIETTLSNLEHMDFESDLEAASVRLIEEIKNLRAARHKLRDNQEVAFLAIARQEGRMDKIAKQLFNDPLTQTYNRTGLEAILWDWWKQGRQKSRQMNAVLFDLDRFGLLNEEHGILVCDRILHQIGQLIVQASGSADLVGRFGGQRFLAVMLDIGPRAATKNAEKLRQSIERIAFTHGGQEIRVTARSGITEVTPNDSVDSLIERLDTALKEAKEAGTNRSFFHDGRGAKLVESPNLGAEHREIAI